MYLDVLNWQADEYAIYRKLFKAEPAYQPAIHLKEQEVDEYTYDVIRCYPSDEKGEVTMVERSASYCW